MSGFIDSSGLGAKQIEVPAKRQPFRLRGPGGAGGKLWPALVAGGMGAATMTLIGMGSVNPPRTQQTVTITIAEPACVRNPASCYPIDAIGQFKEELRKAIAAQPPTGAAGAAGGGAGGETGGSAGRSIVLPSEGGLVPQRTAPAAAGN